MTNYPPGMALRPITSWPHAWTIDRRRAPFSATFDTTLRQLDYELYQLGPINSGNAPSVLQVAVAESKFRRDGMPRADANPEHPGVILSIESRHGALSYPCDTFTRWTDNLRAITLALEALRRVDRYGVTQSGQQYRGWQAIESAPAEPDMNAEQLVSVLGAAAGLATPVFDTSAVNLARIYRTAKANTHPDRGGDRADWDRVQKAAEQLMRMGWL